MYSSHRFPTQCVATLVAFRSAMRRDEISETAFAAVARRVITVMHRFRIKTRHVPPVARDENLNHGRMFYLRLVDVATNTRRKAAVLLVNAIYGPIIIFN